MKKLKENITHVARFKEIDFYLITDEQPVSSLKYTLGLVIAQKGKGLFHNGDEDNVEDEIIIIPIEQYDKKIPVNFEIHTLRNVDDIEGFFIRLT